jgi:hypothetical protein
MGTVVYCLAPSQAVAVRIAERLYNTGFQAKDISMAQPQLSGAKGIAHSDSTKAPEGAVAGASTGALLGGALGWAAGVGALAIPGLGPLIAAGPILATLSGLAAGVAAGGVTGALVGAGIPEYEAQQYAGRMQQGHILIAVHADNSEEAALAKQVMTEEKGESISTATEVAAASTTDTSDSRRPTSR